jgi:hypothetical protein
MPSSIAVDVAIGLAFIYFILSLVCSVANETLAGALGWRAKFLKKGLANILLDPSIDDADARLKKVEGDIDALFRTSLIAPMVREDAGHRKNKTRYPSYIPAKTFVGAVLEGARAAAGAEAEVAKLIEHVPPGRVRDAFAEIYKRVDGDARRFQNAAEDWYDATMERVSGWYKRRTHIAIWCWAILIAIVLNVDSIHIARTLWTDKAVRSAVTQQAQLRTQTGRGDTDRFETVARQVGQLDQVKVPMGWSHSNSPHSFWEGLSKLLGVLITAAALSLGAPFWFDLLNKVARLRAGGAPPPKARNIRKTSAPSAVAVATTEGDASVGTTDAAGGGQT